MKSIFDEGYDKGFAEGCRMSEMSDAYWLRVYAGQAMQGLLHGMQTIPVLEEDIAAEQATQAYYAVKQAHALLADLSKAEVQDE